LERDSASEQQQSAQRRSAELEGEVASLQQQLDKAATAAAARERDSRRHLQRLAVAAARREREIAQLRVQDDGVRLGSISVMRAGPIGAPSIL